MKDRHIIVTDLKPVHIVSALQALELADLYTNGMLNDEEFLYALGYDVPQQDTLILCDTANLIPE